MTEGLLVSAGDDGPERIDGLHERGRDVTAAVMAGLGEIGRQFFHLIVTDEAGHMQRIHQGRVHVCAGKLAGRGAVGKVRWVQLGW